jgi:PAS domain S-box-containing protein
VEDDPADADLVRQHLLDSSEDVPDVVAVATLARAIEHLEREEYAAVLLDLDLPDSFGLDTLDRIVPHASSTPVIVMTDGGATDVGIEAVSRGAADFLPKDELTGRLLMRSVRYAVERSHLRGIEATYRALVENSRDVVSILDRDLVVRYVSPSIRQVLGYEPEERIGTPGALEVHPDDRETVLREVEGLRADPGQTARMSNRVRHKDGGWRVLDTVVLNCFDDPHIQGLVTSSHDVTDLRQAEEIASQNARRLDRTLGALDDVVLTLELPGRRITTCNPNAETTFGYSRGEMAGRSKEMLHADREVYAGFVKESLDSLERGDAHRAESRMRRKDGTVFPAEITVTLLDPAKGPEGGMMSVIRDISERVEQARQVRFQAALLEQVGQMVLAVDAAGCVTYWNHAAEALTGFTRGDVEGRPLAEVIVHESHLEAAMVARETARAGGRWEGEIGLRKKGGGEVIVRVTLTPGANPDGSPGGRIASGVDVTELRRAEAESRRATERLRLQAEMLEAVGQAVIATDVEGRIIFWNRSAEHMYGWAREEVMGRPVREVTPTGASRAEAADIFETLRKGEIWTGEFELRRRDGSTFRALVTDAPILGPDGSLIGIIGVSSDITERRHLEEQLRQALKMEAIGRLAGGVAHDFNNLLTVIEGRASLVLADLPVGSPSREDVEEIRGAGRRAADLTRRLLAFSRKQVLKERRVDLGAEALDLKTMLGRLVPERIEFRMKVEPGNLVVMADPGQLHQVVMNLVVNATDAIEEGGTITVGVDAVELTQEDVDAIPWAIDPGPYVRLTVADTGIGIPPDVMEHIFEPFFTTKPETHGTGLGLATVYGIVKQSGGHVLVDTVPGRGSTFQVLLRRLSVGADQFPERLERPTPDTEGVVVLLVEDDAAVRGIARHVLLQGGYTVLEAENGREALELASRRRGEVDVVISDVVMPELGGIELQKRLQEEDPRVRFILASGYSEAEVRGEIRDLGTLFLSKPFSPKSLLGCVAECLAREP